MNTNYKADIAASLSGLVIYGALSYLITMLFNNPDLTLFAQVFAAMTFIVLVFSAVLFRKFHNIPGDPEMREELLVLWIGAAIFGVVELVSFVNAHFFGWWLTVFNSPFVGDQSKIDSLILQSNICLIGLSCVVLIAVCVEVRLAIVRLMKKGFGATA